MSKKNKLIISVIVVGIIVIIVFLSGYFKRKNSEDYMADFEPTNRFDEDYFVTSIDRVKIRTNYFIARNAIIQLYSNFDTLTSEYATLEEIEVANKNIYNLLESTYRNDKGFELQVKKDDFVDIYELTNNLLIDDMYVMEKDTNISVYVIYGSSENISSTVKKDFKYVVECDRTNGTYAIIPSTEYVDEMGLGNVQIGSQYNMDRYTDIPRVGNINAFSEKVKSDDSYVDELLYDLKRRVSTDKEYLYDYMLVDDYKNNNFGSAEEFFEFCKNNTKRFVTLNFVAYNKLKNGEETIYYCMDENDIMYTFVETAPMKYKFKID